jgi:hypothetical protein
MYVKVDDIVQLVHYDWVKPATGEENLQNAGLDSTPQSYLVVGPPYF